MQGYITDSELGEADQEFPGIMRLFESLPVKPRTFLDLVRLFDHWSEATDQPRGHETRRQ
jgi:hypothetical protein